MKLINEIFKIEKQEILKCPFCYEEYTDLNIKRCTHCNSELVNKIKYKISKKTKNILICSILIIVILIIGVQQVMQYNSDLEECYIAIKEEQDWDKFESIIEKHTILKEHFSNMAYNKLYLAMDEKIEEIKSGNYNVEEEQVFKWTDYISFYTSDDKYIHIREKEATAEVYKIINIVNKNIEENNFKEAYKNILLAEVKYKDYTVVSPIIQEKRNEVENVAVEEIRQEVQKMIDEENYYPARALVYDYVLVKNSNETLYSLYNICENKIKELQKAEEQAKIEKERFDYEVYCYFGLIAWKTDNITDDIAFSKCAKKFGITKEQAEECYHTVEPKGWWYQDEYPDIFEKYASQYYN